MCPHGASTAYELLNYPEIFEAFESLKKAGKVRHLGVSAHTNSAAILRAAVKARHYSVAMVAYNIVNHRYVDDALAEATGTRSGGDRHEGRAPRSLWTEQRQARRSGPREVSPRCRARPAQSAQKAYIWALRNAHVSAVNSEMVNAQMVKENFPLAASKA